MRKTSHKIFNSCIAVCFVVYFHKNYLLESLLSAIGIFMFSSFPDYIEKIGMKHRGISHNILLYVAMFLISLYLSIDYYWLGLFCASCIFGCILHIIADCFSRRGINVIGYPIRLNFYSTGRFTEHLFVFLVVFCTIIFCVSVLIRI